MYIFMKSNFFRRSDVVIFPLFVACNAKVVTSTGDTLSAPIHLHDTVMVFTKRCPHEVGVNLIPIRLPLFCNFVRDAGFENHFPELGRESLNGLQQIHWMQNYVFLRLPFSQTSDIPCACVSSKGIYLPHPRLFVAALFVLCCFHTYIIRVLRTGFQIAFF